MALEAIFLALRRLGDLKLYVVETIALGLGAGVVYLLVLYALERAPDRRAVLWLLLAGAAVFRVTLLPLAPTLSDDVYRYRWDALVQRAGWNPYTVAPSDPRLAPLRDAHWARIPGPNISTVYPPVTELVLRGVALLTRKPLAFKLPFLAADAFLVVLLAAFLHSTGRRNFQLAIYAWNPLVVVEFAASGHNDSLALAAALVASALIIRRRPVLSTLALSAAVLAKVFPVALAPVWLVRLEWPRRWKSWAATGAAVAFAAACAWPYRSAWPGILGVFRTYRESWVNNASLYLLLEWFSGSPDWARGLGAGVVAGLSLWAAARKLEPLRAAYLLFGAILLLSQNAFSWYFCWVIPLLCFFPNPAWLLLTILQFLSYHVLIGYQAFGRFEFQPFFLWLTYGPFYALLLWQAARGCPPTNASLS